MENGLPQNTIHALAQTSDGFLWLGTEVGLVRFDGVNFATFDEHSKPALPSGDIRCLLAARDGALWIGTGDGLARMKDGAVTLFTTKDGLPGNEIRSLQFDDNHALIVSTNQGVVGIRDGTRPAIFDIADSLRGLHRSFRLCCLTGLMCRAARTALRCYCLARTLSGEPAASFPARAFRRCMRMARTNSGSGPTAGWCATPRQAG